MRLSILLALGWLSVGSADAQGVPPCSIETIAGSDVVLGEGMPAAEAELFLPWDARRAPDGSLWISEYGQHVIRRIGPDGALRTVVGTGAKGFSGDGGPAVAAQISHPTGMVFAPDGTLYFGDSGNGRIRRVSPEGIIDTVVGNATSEFGGEDVPALSTRAGGFVGLAFSTEGEPVFSTSDDHRVRRLTSDGRVVTIAGTTRVGSATGGRSGDGGPASEAALNNPLDIAIAADGTIYVADQFGATIRRITPDGVIDTYLLNLGASPDGTPVGEATIRRAGRVEIDPEGRLHWRSPEGIRRVSSDGLLETVAAVNAPPNSYFSLDSDGAPLLIENNSVSRWNGSELVVLAGIGAHSPLGDGGPATAARLYEPHALAIGPAGEVYIADSGILRVRVVGTDGIIRNFTGTGARRTDFLEGPATEVPFFFVRDIAADGLGNVYVPDGDRLARVDANGSLTTLVPPQTGCSFSCGDGGPAGNAATPDIRRVTADSVGNVYVLHRTPIGPSYWIRRIAPDGTIETLTPNLPDGTQATLVYGIAVSADDQLLVSMDAGTSRGFWRYHPDTGWSEIGLAEGYLQVTAALAQANGDLFVVEVPNQVRRMTAEGAITTVAGRSSGGFSGDGGPAAEALLSGPMDVALDQNGNLYIADANNGRVRRVNRVFECDAPPRAPTIALNGTLHGASYGSRVAPGTIFSVFGRWLGPEDLTAAQLEGDRFPTALAGVRVLINGIPAPLIFVSGAQLSGIVPYGVEVDLEWSELGQQFFPAALSFLEIESNGVRSEPYRFSIYEAAPGIFSLDSSGRGPGAILNQDGSVNGALNPAAPGSVIVFYATGEGVTDPPSEDGKIAGAVLPKPTLPVTVKIGGIEAEVLYAGAAPGLTAGVMQVNARIPADLAQLGAVSIELIVGARSSGTGVFAIVGF